MDEVVQCCRLRRLKCICCGFKGGSVPSALWDLVELDVLDLGEMDLDIIVTVAAHQLKWLCYFSLKGNKMLLLGNDCCRDAMHRVQWVRVVSVWPLTQAVLHPLCV